MASLTGCLKKAGAALRAEDKAAILDRARELRAAGQSRAEAGRMAVQEHLGAVRDLLDNAERADIAPKPAVREPDSALEARLRNRIAQDFDGAVRAYDALPDSHGGKILNTDTARELSPDYMADRTRSAAVHEPASQFIKDLYARKLAEAPADGQLPIVLFTAGGTGAGKSSAVQGLASLGRMVDEAQIVYDTNMNGYDSARGKIEQALAAGKGVEIVLVARDPEDALVNGALPRAERQRAQFGTGRTVPIQEHIRTHVGAIETVKRLASDYAGDDRVAIHVVDNSLGKGKAQERSISWLADLKYNDVEQRVRAALEREREAGRISAETYQGFAGDGPSAPRSDAGPATPDGSVSQGNRPGDGGLPEPQGQQGPLTPAAPGAAGDSAAARVAATLNDFPELTVMVDGMDAPVRAADFLAAAKAEADDLAADAPLMQAAAECVLLNGIG